MGCGKSNNSGAKAQAAAMTEQARASVKAANISAAAARDVANAQLKGMETQAKASMFAAQQSAMGGVIGAALGANTTTEQIKQWLPHESGAATIASWELAEQWDKTIRMREEGYSDVAIEYALSGKNGKTLHADPTYNSMLMTQKLKQDGMGAVQMFGIKSPSNPHGVDVSEEDWIAIHSMKDPKAMLEVDPKLAAERRNAFDAWEKNMRAQGLGLMVDIYKNPQLAGSHLKAMQGKEALLDPSLAPLVSGMMESPNGEGGGTDWDAVIRALTTGEQNPMTAQVEKLKEMGIVDKYGMVQAGSIMQHIPPELREPLAFNPYNQLDEKSLLMLKDTYRKFSEMQVDPKLIQESNIGYGVTRKVKLNPDGSIAGHVMEGYMTNMNGEQVYMAMSGNRLQEWYDRQSMISGMGPLFPGMMAPTTDEELNGTFEPGFWGANQLAKPSTGSKGQTPTTGQNPYGASTAPRSSTPKTNIAPTQVTPDSMSGTGASGTASNGNPAASVGGAPLAAGE